MQDSPLFGLAYVSCSLNVTFLMRYDKSSAPPGRKFNGGGSLDTDGSGGGEVADVRNSVHLCVSAGYQLNLLPGHVEITDDLAEPSFAPLRSGTAPLSRI